MNKLILSVICKMQGRNPEAVLKMLVNKKNEGKH